MPTVIGSDSFGQKLAQALGVKFIPLENRVFPEKEICPILKGKPDSRVILADRMKAPINPNTHFVSVLLTIKNLKSLGVEHIDLVMPYFIYSRQDKVFRDGEPFSAKHVLELLKESGADRFFTVRISAAGIIIPFIILLIIICCSLIYPVKEIRKFNYIDRLR